ncbi:MAG: rhodanese-like domain-containing protein [Tepidisphaeraceae bacterium]
MQRRICLLVLLLAVIGAGLCGLPGSSAPAGLQNPAIDMQGFLRAAGEAAKHREARRVSEDEFLRMSHEPGTIVLDARSREKFGELHIAGAVSLPFPDITIESLARLIPDKSTRILIYCNNNFRNAPGPFPTKLPTASLNLSTYVALYDYGYRNVYELAPQLDPTDTILKLIPASR